MGQSGSLLCSLHLASSLVAGQLPVQVATVVPVSKVLNSFPHKYVTVATDGTYLHKRKQPSTSDDEQL